jgi:tetratricopeptide (TPR) repeat protein
VPEERQAIVRLVKDKLPYDPLLQGRATFEVLAWDDAAQKVVLLAGESGQASVDRALGVPSACDLTVVVLWARLGTPPADRPPKPDGTPYRSGTEWELDDALAAGKPVLVCRRLAKAQVDATDPEALQEFARQAQLVNDLFGELATRRVNVNTYTEPGEVAALVEGELKRMVRRRLPDADDSPGAATTARPFTVPAPVADFTGREEEIAALEEALTSGTGRAAICAVHGLGGVGKSQLAYELARRTAACFPDGQVHLDLRGTAPDPLAPEAALAELIRAVHPEAKPPADLAGLKALYLQAWHGRRVLLLLDDARDEAQVRDLAPPAPVALLVTSRRAIVPEGGRMVRLDVLPEPQAMGLLREVLGRARDLAEEEARELAQECGRLPLALRAAAGFLLRRPAWGVAEYLAELRGRRIAALDKVTTVLGLSLDRLANEDGELARRFTLLGAFPAGFNAAAAAAVWQAEPRAARDGLDALAEWSLVQVEAVGRYRLHDLVRDLAANHAAAALEEARARHAGHYAAVLAQAEELYLSGGAGVLRGLALFDAERANIEAGHRWAVGNAVGREDAAALAPRYSDMGENVLYLRLTPQQQIEWFEAVLIVCRRLGDRRGEGQALRNLGLAWAALGEVRKAVGFYEQALAIARELGDRRGEAGSLYNSAHVHETLGERDKALADAKAALVIFRAIESPRVASVEAWLRERGHEP